MVAARNVPHSQTLDLNVAEALADLLQHQSRLLPLALRRGRHRVDGTRRRRSIPRTLPHRRGTRRRFLRRRSAPPPRAGSG